MRAPERSRAPRTRRREQREEGAVMLVVLLVIMTATAASMVALTGVQTELRATGAQRVALQTRQVSDTAMVTTLAWLDVLGRSGQFWQYWQAWQARPQPTMQEYPEPPIQTVLGSTVAMRMTMETHRHLRVVQTSEAPILSNPQSAGGAGGGGGGGSGGSGGSGPVPYVDTTGTFGPGQGYALPEAGYVVDLTDCARAPAGLTPGSPVSGGSGFDVVSFVCTVTARGRLNGGGGARTWTFGSWTYTQNEFQTANDARMTIVTPEMLVPK